MSTNEKTSLLSYFQTMVHVAKMFENLGNNKLLIGLDREGLYRVKAMVRHVGEIKIEYIDSVGHVFVSVLKDQRSYSMEIVDIMIEDNTMSLIDTIIKFGQEKTLIEVV